MARSLEELYDDTTADATPSATPSPASEGAAASPEPVSAEAAAPVSEVPASPPTPEPAKDESGAKGADPATGTDKDAPPASGEETVEPISPSDSPQVKAFKTKALDETRKRQERDKQLRERDQTIVAKDKELAEIKAHIERLQQRPPEAAPRGNQPPPRGARPPQQRRAPDPDNDPGQAIRYMGAAVQNDIRTLKTEFAEELWKRDVVHSQSLMRLKHTDYDEMEEIFANARDQDPSLQAQLQAHPDPARFAYDTGKKLKRLHEMGDDPDGYWQRREQELEKTLRERWEAENADKLPHPGVQPQPAPAMSASPVATYRPPAAPAPSPPRSLAGVTSAAPRSPTRTYDGLTPLEKLLG